MDELDDQIRSLAPGGDIERLIRAAAAQNSVLTDRRANYLSMRPTPIGAIAVYFHADRVSIAVDPHEVEAVSAQVPGSRIERKTPATHYLVIEARSVTSDLLDIIAKALDWRVQGPQVTLGPGRNAATRVEPDICPNCNTTITPADTCLCD